MSNELSKTVSMYKELLDDGLITEEKYYEFIEHLINKKAKEEVKQVRPVDELKKRIASYEERDRKEYEQKQRDDIAKKDVAFAVSFLSQVYNSYGDRVYSDEVLNNEKEMTLLDMQKLIFKYKENAPEMYNEIVNKINGKEEEISNRILNKPVSLPTEEVKEDFSELQSENDVEAQKEDFALLQEEEKMKSVDAQKADFALLESEEKIKNDEVQKEDFASLVGDEQQKANEVDDSSNEIVEEMLEDGPIKRRLISIKQAGSTLINKIKGSDKKIKSDTIKASLYIGAMVAGAVIAGPAGVAVAAVGGVGVAALNSKSR